MDFIRGSSIQRSNVVAQSYKDVQKNMGEEVMGRKPDTFIEKWMKRTKDMNWAELTSLQRIGNYRKQKGIYDWKKR